MAALATPAGKSPVIVVAGAPCSGKGTQGKILADMAGCVREE